MYFFFNKNFKKIKREESLAEVVMRYCRMVCLSLWSIIFYAIGNDDLASGAETTDGSSLDY